MCRLLPLGYVYWFLILSLDVSQGGSHKGGERVNSSCIDWKEKKYWGNNAVPLKLFLLASC
jgi:hypothetical protein